MLALAGCRQVATQSSGALDREPERASYADAINKVAPAVVSIYTFSAAGKAAHEPRRKTTDRPPLTQLQVDSARAELQGLGSGVLTTPDGYILTTGHVVEGAEKITAITADGHEFEATVIGVDSATDLAVIKVRAKNMPKALFGDSSRLRVGDVVLAVGNSFGVGQTVTSGIVSATDRSGFGVMDYENFIQTDASINPGNSGGALADSRGRVIGINSAILTSGGGSEGIGFAIPINMAKGVMLQLIAHGKVVRGYLGVSVRPLTLDLAQAFNLPVGKGAFVVEVEPGSPAARAGVQEGDIIVQLNGQRVEGSRSFRMQIAGSQPGARMELKIIRVGRQQAITAQLEESPPASRAGKAVGGSGEER
jgi:Do/DeqQ family serine protease